LDFGHSPLTPLSFFQNKKTKLKFFFRAIPIAIVKHAHHITRHIWLRLLYKSLHPYLPPLRYGKHQICRNVLATSPFGLCHQNDAPGSACSPALSPYGRHRRTAGLAQCLTLGFAGSRHFAKPGASLAVMLKGHRRPKN